MIQRRDKEYVATNGDITITCLHISVLEIMALTGLRVGKSPPKFAGIFPEK